MWRKQSGNYKLKVVYTVMISCSHTKYLVLLRRLDGFLLSGWLKGNIDGASKVILVLVLFHFALGIKMVI